MVSLRLLISAKYYFYSLDTGKMSSVRRSIFDLKSAYMRAHILEGLKKALDIIDEIIKTIRGTKPDEDAKTKLMDKFGFTDLQAQAILEMQLKKLSGLERQKLDEEYKEVEETITNLTAIITIPEKMVAIIKSENKEIAENTLILV